MKTPRGDILRRRHVAADLPERSGMHEVQVPPNQARKRRLRSVLRGLAEQSGIVVRGMGRSVIVTSKCPLPEKPNRKK